MSNFDRLKPIMDYAINTGQISTKGLETVREFRLKQAYEKLPFDVSKTENPQNIGLFLLRRTADVLTEIGNKDFGKALDLTKDTMNLTLVGDPFDGGFYQLAAKTAELLRNTELQTTFQNRYNTYQELYSDAKALIGLPALFNPEYEAYLENMLEPKFDEIGESSSHVGITPPLSDEPFLKGSQITNYGYAPVSRGEDSSLLINTKIFSDTKTLDVIISEAQWEDITNGGQWGRHDEDKGEVYADICLTFTTNALESLEHLTNKGFKIRLLDKVRKGEPIEFTTDSISNIETEDNTLLFSLLIPYELIEGKNKYDELSDVWKQIDTVVLARTEN